jgi:hyperosmotically inducible protein
MSYKTIGMVTGAFAALCISLGAMAGAAADAGVVIDDSVITAKVKTALIEEPSTKAHDIKVTTVNGVVSLHGAVDSPAAKAKAGEIAQDTDGVSMVRNELTIRRGQGTSSIGQNVDDSILTTRVKAALIDDPTTKAREISVSTNHGVVRLTGTVGSMDEKMEAARVAATIDGVKDVRNHLEVKTM